MSWYIEDIPNTWLRRAVLVVAFVPLYLVAIVEHGSKLAWEIAVEARHLFTRAWRRR